MTDRDEHRASQPQQDHVDRLRDRRAAHLRAVERIDASLGQKPRLRDRNRFFNGLLNGELNEFERVGPQWRERQQRSRAAARLKTEIDAAVRRRLETDDSRYRRLLAQTGQEKNLKRSCRRLLRSIHVASKQINRASGRRSGDPAAAQAAKEVSKRMRLVRKRADAVRGMISPPRSLDGGEVPTFEVGAGTDDKVRSQQYKDAKALLDSLERSVRTLRRDVESRERAVKSERLRYLRSAQARFTKE